MDLPAAHMEIAGPVRANKPSGLASRLGAVAGPDRLLVASSMFPIVAGMLGLSGWILEIDILKSVIPGAVQMKANTALALLAMGMALSLARPRASSRRVQLALGISVAVVLLGVATLVQYATGLAFGIDELIFTDAAHAYNTAPGRMSPLAAWCFVLVGAGLCADIGGERMLRRTWREAALAVAGVQVVLVGFVAVLGHLWNAAELVTEAWLPPVAANTALALVAMGASMLGRMAQLAQSTPFGVAHATGAKRPLAAFWMMVPILVASAGWLYRSNVDFSRAAWFVAHTQEVRLELARLEACLDRAQLLQAQLPAVPAAAFEMQAARCPLIVDRIHRLVADNPSQQLRVQTLKEPLVPTLLAQLRASRREAVDALSADIASAIGALDAAEQSLLATREATASSQRATMLLSLLGTLLVAIGLFFLLIRGMRSEVSRSEKLRSEMALQKALLRDVINAVPDVIAYTDASGKYLGCNQAYARMLGRAPSDVAGRRAAELFSGEVAEQVRLLDEAVLVGRNTRTDEVWLAGPDGERALFEMVRSPLHQSSGAPAGLLITGRDITLRKQVEEQLTTARLLAEQAARAKSEFLANMSHEIRTPMTAVLGMVDLLAAEDLTPAQERYVQSIGASGRHLLNVINDILDFSRLESGRLEIEDIDFCLPDVLEQVRSVVNYLAVERGIGFHVELVPHSPAPLRGDPTRILQVLLNLVGNAIKFTERGSVLLLVEQGPSTGTAFRIRFEVRDTGVGIAPDVLGQLFSPFQQADSSTARRFGGSGLGLAICKRLVKAMGGEIQVLSEVRVGSRFFFDLVLEQGDAQALMKVDKALGLPMARRRILVAEDVETNRDLLAAMLGRQGHDVVFAQDGAQALALVQASSFDLVLMDVQMPVMDGVEATRRIRKLAPPLGGLPIVGLTANVMTRERERYLGAGMDACLKKPFDWHELSETIQKFTGAYAPAGALPSMPPLEQPAPALGAVDSEMLTAIEMGMGASAARALVAKALDTFQQYCEDVLPHRGGDGEVLSVGACAHKLKGTAGSLGLRAIADAAIRADQSPGRSVDRAAFVEELQSAILATRQELQLAS